MSQHSRLALESFKKNKLQVPKIDFANIKVAANPDTAQHRYGDSTCGPKTHVESESMSQALGTDAWIRPAFDFDIYKKIKHKCWISVVANNMLFATRTWTTCHVPHAEFTAFFLAAKI
jgi:hypothetical protein